MPERSNVNGKGTKPPSDRPGAVEPEHAGEAAPQTQTTFSASQGLAARLARLDVTLGFTSYQSNLLYVVGRKSDGGLQMHQSRMPRPMGLRFGGEGTLLLSAGTQILRFENVLRPGERANGLYDACFVPRQIHLTGHLDAHDVGLAADGTPIFANTRFNCLATVDPRDSFRALWRPPFVSALVDEDRCHLNGLAMRDGEPAFVTAVSRSDTIDGWRDRRADGGVVVDVKTGEIVCAGLSMPHSPRWHDGELWVLNSGTGDLCRVPAPAGGSIGRSEPRAFCPGFVRGLALHDRYAFVGLSKPRYRRFEGLALDDRLREADSEPWCGVQIIDVTTGTCVDWLRIDGAVAEIYDVEVLPGIVCAMTVSPASPDIANLITFSD